MIGLFVGGGNFFPNLTAEAIDVPKKVEDVGWVPKDWKEFYWFSAFHLFFNLIYACVPTYMYVAIFILPVIITPTLLLWLTCFVSVFNSFEYFIPDLHWRSCKHGTCVSYRSTLLSGDHQLHFQLQLHGFIFTLFRDKIYSSHAPNLLKVAIILPSKKHFMIMQTTMKQNVFNNIIITAYTTV